MKKNGAAEKTRTSTGVSPQRPQRCASTNSATAARLRNPCMSPSFSFIKPVSPPKAKKTKTRPSAAFVHQHPKPHTPELHDQWENIASHQKASYAMDINHDDFSQTGSYLCRQQPRLKMRVKTPPYRQCPACRWHGAILPVSSPMSRFWPKCRLL